MMAQPILMLSDEPSESAWVRVDERTRALRVQGMVRGDILDVSMVGNPSMLKLSVYEDGIFEIPDGVDKVKVKHSMARGGRVSVDLVNHGP